MKQFKEILIVNGNVNELYSYKRTMDMFGLAEHIQTETNGTSALQYLKSGATPAYICASLEPGEPSIIDFVEEYEKLHWTKRKKMELVLLYKELHEEFERLKRYRLEKKPLNVFALLDKRPPEDRLLN